nr:MAG TPA: hypothetical protein [Caudoviricetes sp.]
MLVFLMPLTHSCRIYNRPMPRLAIAVKIHRSHRPAQHRFAVLAC